MRDARYVRLISWTLQSGSEHKQLIAGSQSADSRYKLAAIEPKEGISLPPQVKRISSSVPIYAISQYWKAH
jgi:hypothetical protein